MSKINYYFKLFVSRHKLHSTNYTWKRFNTKLPDNEWIVSEDITFEPGAEAEQRFGFLIGPSAEEIEARKNDTPAMKLIG